MPVTIPIKGVEFLIDNKCLALKFERKWFSLSSAVLNGGFQKVKAIVNYQVDKDFSDENPEAFLKKALRNFPKPIVGLMTAADITKFSLKTIRGNLPICALVTAGISNAASAGEKINCMQNLSTINIIVLVDGCLSEACMVNLIETITEAKSMALIDLDVRSKFSGEAASGTTTDAIVVACREKGEKIKYAGTGTKLGMLAGKIVREAIKESLRKQGFYPNRPFIQRLEERGISLNQIIDFILEYKPELKSFSKEKIRKIIEETLKDVSIVSLIMAGLRLEEDKAKGLIPEMKKNIDSTLIDKAFGVYIAKLINGDYGAQEFFDLHKTKLLKISKLGVFSRSVIEGLLAGVSSKLKAIG
jgi:iron complex transport system ATP-binding protein